VDDITEEWSKRQWFTENIRFSSHNYYTLLVAPKAPMTVPWDDVLVYVCDWAEGKTN